MMERTRNIVVEDRGLRTASLVYYAVMFAAFIVGLYGFFSLFFLASSEVQNSIRYIQ